jgi:hypothetical protein
MADAEEASAEGATPPPAPRGGLLADMRSSGIGHLLAARFAQIASAWAFRGAVSLRAVRVACAHGIALVQACWWRTRSYRR